MESPLSPMPEPIITPPSPQEEQPASPVRPQASAQPGSRLPKHFLTPVLLLFAAMIGTGYYLMSQNPGGTVGETARPLAAPMLTKEDVAAQKAFLVKQFGGESANASHRSLVSRIGGGIATKSEAKDSGKPYHFTVLAEPDVINAFALPTGEVYVTTALVNRMKTEGELAAALANAVAHATLNHRLEPMAPTGAGTPEASTLTYRAEQETAADGRALKMMADAGYSPEAYLGMFRLLTEAYHAGANVQFFATHPSADWRLNTVAESIKKMYPEGIPAELSK